MSTQEGKQLLEKLAGSDRRSIGRANEVVDEVLHNPSLFGALFNGLYNNAPLIRMRAADAIEKITATRPEWLEPYKEKLIGTVAAFDQQEIRWHVAQMLPRLTLTRAERSAVVSVLKGYLKDKSSIVRTSAMQALADLAEHDEHLRGEVIDLLQSLMRTGTPAMKSRGRTLFKQFGVVDPRITWRQTI